MSQDFLVSSHTQETAPDCDVDVGPSTLESAAKEAAMEDGLIPVEQVLDLRSRKTNLRRGKWTAEEEAYANRLIYEFRLGLLPLTEGTTLRTFLSKLLNCDPMRISKKFVGQNCIGKQVFRRRQQDQDMLSAIEIESSRKELAELERKFLDRVAHSNRSKNANSTVVSAAMAAIGSAPSSSAAALATTTAVAAAAAAAHTRPAKDGSKRQVVANNNRRNRGSEVPSTWVSMGDEAQDKRPKHAASSSSSSSPSPASATTSLQPIPVRVLSTYPPYVNGPPSGYPALNPSNGYSGGMLPVYHPNQVQYPYVHTYPYPPPPPPSALFAHDYSSTSAQPSMVSIDAARSFQSNGSFEMFYVPSTTSSESMYRNLAGFSGDRSSSELRGSSGLGSMEWLSFSNLVGASESMESPSVVYNSGAHPFRQSAGNGSSGNIVAAGGNSNRGSGGEAGPSNNSSNSSNSSGSSSNCRSGGDGRGEDREVRGGAGDASHGERGDGSSSIRHSNELLLREDETRRKMEDETADQVDSFQKSRSRTISDDVGLPLDEQSIPTAQPSTVLPQFRLMHHFPLARDSARSPSQLPSLRGADAVGTENCADGVGGQGDVTGAIHALSTLSSMPLRRTAEAGYLSANSADMTSHVQVDAVDAATIASSSASALDLQAGVSLKDFHRNSSVENFWLLVNNGDLPRPDRNVLSETLWHAHTGQSRYPIAATADAVTTETTSSSRPITQGPAVEASVRTSSHIHTETDVETLASSRCRDTDTGGTYKADGAGRRSSSPYDANGHGFHDEHNRNKRIKTE